MLSPSPCPASVVNNWRVARVIPRIISFELRAPTPLETQRGADVGYTVTFIEPDSGGPFWFHRLEFSNRDGQHWQDGTSAWNGLVVASKERSWNNPDFMAPGNADNRNGITVELTGGYKWKRIAGENARIEAKIALWPDGAEGETSRQTARFRFEEAEFSRLNTT